MLIKHMILFFRQMVYLHNQSRDQGLWVSMLDPSCVSCVTLEKLEGFLRGFLFLSFPFSLKMVKYKNNPIL